MGGLATCKSWLTAGAVTETLVFPCACHAHGNAGSAALPSTTLIELSTLRQVFNPSNGRSRPARVVRPVIIVVIAGPPGGPATIIKWATTCQPDSKRCQVFLLLWLFLCWQSCTLETHGTLKLTSMSVLCDAQPGSKVTRKVSCELSGTSPACIGSMQARKLCKTVH